MPALLLFLALPQLAMAMPASEPAVQRIEQAEAVRSGWDATWPPGDWVPVQLMDFWTARWPDHDGVVWYRVRWTQADARAPAGLLVDYACMASAVYLNGSLVARDRSLAEPLSRGWVKPRYILLDAPLLRAGENTLLVRVSGLSAYQPGLGPITVGDPALVQAQYERNLFLRFQVKLVNAAMSAVLGAIFLLIWLLRRQDTTYGWFALSELFGAAYASNFVVSSPWPFASTDGWQAFVITMYVLGGASYAMFLLRFGERTIPWAKRTMAATCVAAVLALLFAPGWMGPNRLPWAVAGGLFYYAGTAWFMVRAWREPRLDYRVLAVCVLAPVLVSFHDFAMFLGWVRATTPLLALTSVLTLVGIGFVLAYRFVSAMRRVEGFNVELQREVDAATTRLAETLAREHALALAHSRAGERLQLVRDLHDGFGGTLVGTIARLEQGPEHMPRTDLVDQLKEMRDDLRLVIDSTAREHADLAELLAPLRHRASRLFDAAGIDDQWRLEGLEGVDLGGARSLDLLRLLQEAFTNVFKHSRAANVEIGIVRDGGRIRMRIADDGIGLAGCADGLPSGGGGAGMSSMRLRAQRLGGCLEVVDRAPGTELVVDVPFSS